MINILITGSNGFIGKNLMKSLNNTYNKLYEFNDGDSLDYISEISSKIDVVVHLAGVQRPSSVDEFYEINFNLTKEIFKRLDKSRLKLIIFSSSIHVETIPESHYSISKRETEDYLIEFVSESSISLVTYRFHNIFGPLGRPNYNSVVANFCYNISHGEKIVISNSSLIFRCHYIDDVISDINSNISNIGGSKAINILKKVEPVYELSLGKLYSLILFISEGIEMNEKIYKPLKTTYNWYKNLK